ncbi:hypothetical protein SGUI_2621 [Serinicoccus hydrothermalis]|uniref:Low molecular weight protein antigen 6 PH domain-containing protein n=1 Tax=Serinicoccus hydrothermalis TaxID=1758689 RepID=A0A1B1NEZ8_9MICO|nr:PH domain-containing protein [Serinicoccus hydrothermalis]ANS80017.1 hypothetical protein SGUI_2621 [Serinicoccus hydrothermalis]
MRRLAWGLAFFAVLFLLLAAWEVVDGNLGEAAWRAVFGGVVGLQAWMTLSTRTTADTTGLRLRQPPSRTVHLAWDDVVDVEVRREPKMLARVVVETVDGREIRPPMVPVEDVEELRSWWLAARRPEEHGLADDGGPARDE